MMTTLRFDGQTTVGDLLGLLAEQEGLSTEEAADYVIRTPDTILSPDIHLKSLSMASLVYLEHVPRLQRIKLTTQDGSGTSKFMSLDAVVPITQLLGTISSQFGIKEEQIGLTLQTIVCPHPSIIFNDLIESESRLFTTVGIAQNPNISNLSRAPSSPSSGSSVVICSSNSLPPSSTPIELDLTMSLFQQGVRSGAHLTVIRRKRSLMNKLRRSLLPSSSKDKALTADLNAALALGSTTPNSATTSPTSTSPAPVYNTPSRFSRSSTSFLLRLVQQIEASSLTTPNLFSRDHSPQFLLAYKLFMDTISSSTSDHDFYSDGTALGALLRHCLTSMSPKLLEPIQADLCPLADQLPVVSNQPSSVITTHISQQLSHLETDEKTLFNHLIHLLHELSTTEATSGYSPSTLASIFVPLLAQVEANPPSPTPSPPASPRDFSKHNALGRLSAIMAFLIESPGACGESPFKKRSKRDRKMRKLSSSPSIVQPSSPSSPSGGKLAPSSGESEQSASSPDSVRKGFDRSSSFRSTNLTKKSSNSNLSGTNTSSGMPSSHSGEERSSNGAKNPKNAATSPDSNASSSATDDSSKEPSSGPIPLSTPTGNTFMVADFAWTPTMDGDLELHKGDILQVLVTDPQGWYVGKLLNVPGNPIGVFPSTYCSHVSKREITSLLKLEDISLFESDDASSDDSSSSFSTSSLYQHLVQARMGNSSYLPSTGTVSPTSTPSIFNPAHSLSYSLQSTTPTSSRRADSQSPSEAHSTPFREVSVDLPSQPPVPLSPPTKAKAPPKTSPKKPPKGASIVAKVKKQQELNPALKSIESPLSASSAHVPHTTNVEAREPAVRSLSNSVIQAKSDKVVSPTNSEPIVTLRHLSMHATILDAKKMETPTGGREGEQKPEISLTSGSTASSELIPAGTLYDDDQSVPSHWSGRKSASETDSTELVGDSFNTNLTSTSASSTDSIQAVPSSTSPTASNLSSLALLNIGLGSESVKPIKYSPAAYAHSKVFPIPPGKPPLTGYRMVEPANTPSGETSKTISDPHVGPYVPSGRPATVSTYSTGPSGTMPSGNTGAQAGSASGQDRTNGTGSSGPQKTTSPGAKTRTSLPDPILAPLDISNARPGPNETYFQNSESPSPGNRPKQPRGPLSSSLRHDASYGPKTALQRRLSGPRSPRSDFPAMATMRTWSPTSSAHGSPRDSNASGSNRASINNLDELERRSEEVHALQGNIFALEAFNRHMHNTIAEQEMAIERLTRELELLKSAHALGFGASSAGGSGSGSGNALLSGRSNDLEGDSCEQAAGGSDDETNSGEPHSLSGTSMSSSAGSNTVRPQNAPVRLRKRPSRRISAISSNTESASVSTTSLASSSTSLNTQASNHPTAGPTSVAAPISASASHAHSGTASAGSHSPTSQHRNPTAHLPPAAPQQPAAAIPLTIQLAILVFAIALLLWVIQPQFQSPTVNQLHTP